MCTLTLAWQVFPDAPVVAAANRDEAVTRPSEPPTFRATDGLTPSGPRRILAPRDSVAGGTWIGVNDAGVYVTITNRWLGADLERDRSRGLLVADCLEQETAEDAARYVEREVTERAYDGFNLIVADETAAVVITWDGRLSTTTLAPGVHVVVNVGGVLNDHGQFTIPPDRPERSERQAENARRLRDRLQPEPGEAADDWLDRAGDALGDHDSGVCLHGADFGTVSATKIRLPSRSDTVSEGMAGTPEDFSGLRFEYADGPPCETPFEPGGRTTDRPS